MTKIQLVPFALKHTGNSQWAMFLDDDRQFLEQTLEEGQLIEAALQEICERYFKTHPGFVLQKCRVADVEQEEGDITLVYTTLMPEVECTSGSFYNIQDVLEARGMNVKAQRLLSKLVV